MVQYGDTFLGGGEVHGEDHLWIVINEPRAHEGNALLVNVSTLRPRADTTCVLRSGEHPFIKHESYVRFRSARRALLEDLEFLVGAGRLQRHSPAASAFLERICAAASAALQLPVELRPLL